MPGIRAYCENDRRRVEEICIQTASAEAANTEKKREGLLFLYNKYYTREEGEHCFVLEDDEGRAVGYILCAPDFKRYKRGFLKYEMKMLCKLSPASVVFAYSQVSALKPFAKKYPAHLHIDILSSYQHQGWGSKLLDALITHLEEIGVPGVVLIAGEDNHGAIAFYKKYGMERLGKIGGGVAFGLSLA